MDARPVGKERERTIKQAELGRTDFNFPPILLGFYPACFHYRPHAFHLDAFHGQEVHSFCFSAKQKETHTHTHQN